MFLEASRVASDGGCSVWGICTLTCRRGLLGGDTFRLLDSSWIAKTAKCLRFNEWRIITGFNGHILYFNFGGIIATKNIHFYALDKNQVTRRCRNGNVEKCQCSIPIPVLETNPFVCDICEEFTSGYHSRCANDNCKTKRWCQKCSPFGHLYSPELEFFTGRAEWSPTEIDSTRTCDVQIGKKMEKAIRNWPRWFRGPTQDGTPMIPCWQKASNGGYYKKIVLDKHNSMPFGAEYCEHAVYDGLNMSLGGHQRTKYHKTYLRCKLGKAVANDGSFWELVEVCGVCIGYNVNFDGYRAFYIDMIGSSVDMGWDYPKYAKHSHAPGSIKSFVNLLKSRTDDEELDLVFLHAANEELLSRYVYCGFMRPEALVRVLRWSIEKIQKFEEALL